MSNNGEILLHAALDGLGLLQTSELRVREDLAAGRLVRVLEEYEIASNSAVWAVYPSSKHVLPKLRALLDFLAGLFREVSATPTDSNASAADEKRSFVSMPKPSTRQCQQPNALLP